MSESRYTPGFATRPPDDFGSNGQEVPADDDRPRSWLPRDIEPVLSGTFEPPKPTVGERDDGAGMFYPGRKHTVASESEGGKTWLLLAAIRTELERGNAAVYLDFEDSEGGIVGRLLSLQVPAAALRDRFVYLRPEEPLDVAGRADLAQVLGDVRPTLVAIDGVTEAMVLHGLDPVSNKDAAAFGRMLPTAIAAKGPAVVSLDHVTKSAEGRGRYAIGAVHKLNGLDGAAYILENRNAFGVGITGRSTVLLSKDRPAQLRRHGKRTQGGLHWFADLVIESQHDDFVMADLAAPGEREGSGEWRPTALMTRVVETLRKAGKPLSQRVICDTTTGNAQQLRQALSFLIADGYISANTPHSLVKNYPED